MQDTLRTGIAVFNAGDHHAAHDVWEEPWLALDSGTADERLLHGLIQYAGAVYHARRRNWSGARGLADSAEEYLVPLDGAYRGVNVAGVRAYLRRLAADPVLAERRRPLALRYEGDALDPRDLSFEAAATAAAAIADDYDAFEADVVADAVRFARAERTERTERSTKPESRSGGAPDPTRTRGFVGMLFDFAAERERRSLVYDRLRRHVERERSKERDAAGLFE